MPDPVKLTGKCGRLVEQVRTAISNCAYFQTWVGANNAAAALPSAYTNWVLASTATYPFCVVEQGEELRIEQVAHGAFTPHVVGEIHVVFFDEWDSATYTTLESGYRKFWNDVTGKIDSGVANSYDGIMTQLEAHIAADTYIGNVQAIRSRMPIIDMVEVSGIETTRFEWDWILEFSAR